MFILSAYCILCAIAHSSEVKSDDSDFNVSIDLYDGAQVWEVGLRSSKDIVLIRSLINKEEISIWSLTPKRALFLIEMDNKLNVHRQLSSKGLNHTVLILDVQRRVDEQKIRPVAWDKKTLRRGHRMNWRKYPTVEVINEYMEYLTKNYPSVCKLKEIGKSSENTTIQMLTISNGNPQNQGILLVAGSHAREWIAITSALIILREIVTKFDEQPKYVQDKDWHVIPLLNPDGFRYTYQRDRFWRKSRGRNVKSNCKGVDLNRNFGTDWHIKGVAEKQPCKELYSGPHPFSEPETRALRSIVEKLKSRLVAMVDFHSFGQLIMFPWSSRSKPTVDHNLLENTSKVMQKAIFEYKNKSYTTGQTYQVIYPASGSLLDWMYSVGIRHSYVIEGRDTGEHGFLVPPVYIQEAGQEMYIAVKQLASHLDRKTSVRAQHYPWF